MALIKKSIYSSVGTANIVTTDFNPLVKVAAKKHLHL